VGDLVETLVTGFLVSALFIVIVWWFWRRYDQPSETQLAREEELAKKKEEQQMWRAVEAQIAEEKLALEEKALYLRKRAEQEERARPPAAGALTNALDAFGSVEQPASTTAKEAPAFSNHESAPSEGIEVDGEGLDDALDLDLLLASTPAEVRQDKGVQPTAQAVAEPDWDLVEKLEQLSNSEVLDEVPHPELPVAPDLDVLANTEALIDSDPDDVVQWESDDELPDEDAWDVKWVAGSEEEE
jgi:hypothetical protein